MLENSKGFEIAFNIQGKILRIRVWGDWDTELVKRYDFALRHKIMEISAHAHWKIWYILVDVTRCSCQSEELPFMLEKPFMIANTQEIKKIAYVYNGTNPQSSFTHARDAPAHACFESTDEAVQWLMKE